MTKISFHGAARMVTGSKHLIETGEGVRILLDCGMFQGYGTDADRLNRHFGFDPPRVDFLLISHAHIDHIGLLPLLVKQGFAGTVYCTPATRDLMEIMLLDSGKIQEDDIRYLNKKRVTLGKPLLEPLYVQDDVPPVMKLVKTADYNEKVRLTPHTGFMFTDAGHIIGSAAVHLETETGGRTERITFSGDVGRYEHEILRDPQPFPQADVILCESTYGNELHPDRDAPDEDFLKHILYTCVEKKGKLIIPAFSVGRTQELLYKLNNLYQAGKLPKINYYVDSPLSQKATEVTRKHTYLYNKEVKKVMQTDDDPFDFPGVVYIENADESKQLNFIDEPCVIISASGMADAGRVKHHIANNIARPEATVLIVGYCEPGSLGGKLMNGAKKVRIFGEEYHVTCDVRVMRTLSAHGDYKDLLHFLSCQDPARVRHLFLVHGEYEKQLVFRDHLLQAGFTRIDIPEMHSVREI